MADVDAVTEPMSRSAAVDHFGAWARWWLAGTAADWGYVALSAGLIAGGYFDAWINRHLLVRTWEHALPQAAWAAITIYLGVWAFVSFRRDYDLRTAVPDGYGLAVVGCAVFLAGIVINVWWATAFATDCPRMRSFGRPGSSGIRRMAQSSCPWSLTNCWNSGGLPDHQNCNSRPSWPAKSL